MLPDCPELAGVGRNAGLERHRRVRGSIVGETHAVQLAVDLAAGVIPILEVPDLQNPFAFN